MKKNKIEHTTIRNEKIFCLNCGGSFPLQTPIAVDVLAKKISQFNDLHENCLPTWKEPIADQSKDIEQKAMWWIANGEIGMSSKTIWLHFMGQKIDSYRINHPYDPDDFSRCYKLLEAVPEWKSRILELSTLSTPWKNLSENWGKLTQMFEENERNDWKTSKKIGMYGFMQTLLK